MSFKRFPDKIETFFDKCRFRLPRAGQMGKFCPLLEPIRLHDLLNSARSRTAKKINVVMIHLSLFLSLWPVVHVIPSLLDHIAT